MTLIFSRAVKALFCAAVLQVAFSGNASAETTGAPPTLRVDYIHSGDAKSEGYALDRIVVEPLPWPGNPAQAIDNTNLGANKVEVTDAKTGELLYSRGYSTVFGEWRSTDEAGHVARAFQESVRFPKPTHPVHVRIYKRDDRNAFVTAWEVDIDPDAQDVIRKQGPAPAKVIPIHVSGPSQDKVDLLIIGDGFTKADMPKFIADAKRMSSHLFDVSPFRERANDFNVWAMAVPTQESGVSRPSTHTYHASPLGTRYDIFGSERYVLAVDNRALREIAQYAPYEFIEILVNNETYGGGGIFGQFSTAAVGSDWANYLFVHEFGHHFAGLADEYYTSDVSYETGGPRIEPWEPNVTALKDQANLKWKDKVQPGTALPTPWPKKEFEDEAREFQKHRAELRAANRPEAEMNALFREELKHENALFSPDPNRHTVGAFEGANYESSGYYRPEMACIMFNRSESFCSVCRQAISRIIDLYSTPTSKTGGTSAAKDASASKTLP